MQAMAEIDQAQWDRLALPLETPLLEWQWLNDLEASGSIAPQSGWYPCHLTLWQGSTLVAAAPLYIKTHSEGEFVFDHWWAQLATEYGVAYYPKLVGMSPVTPAVGYRMLMDEGIDPLVAVPHMVAAIDHLCGQLKIASCNLNFIDEAWFEEHTANLFSTWHHQSYLWRNPGYADFNDYLAVFKTTQRRNIRRERLHMEKQGITISALTGNEITQDLAPIMFQYYMRTNAHYGPWAARYLNAEFFERILL